FDECGADGAVVAADVVHPEAAEQVEVARPLAVVQVRAFCARPRPVEADRAQDADELWVDRARPKVEVALACTVEQGPHVHAVNVPGAMRSRRGSTAPALRGTPRESKPCGE